MMQPSSDPFARKEWYDIKAPAVFTNRQVGKTVVNKTAGQSAFFLLRVLFNFFFPLARFAFP